MKLVLLRSCNGMQIHAFVANFVALGGKKIIVPPANAPILCIIIYKNKKGSKLKRMLCTIIVLMWVKA